MTKEEFITINNINNIISKVCIFAKLFDLEITNWDFSNDFIKSNNIILYNNDLIIGNICSKSSNKCCSITLNIDDYQVFGVFDFLTEQILYRINNQFFNINGHITIKTLENGNYNISSSLKTNKNRVSVYFNMALFKLIEITKYEKRDNERFDFGINNNSVGFLNHKKTNLEEQEINYHDVLFVDNINNELKVILTFQDNVKYTLTLPYKINKKNNLELKMQDSNLKLILKEILKNDPDLEKLINSIRQELTIITNCGRKISLYDNLANLSFNNNPSLIFSLAKLKNIKQDKILKRIK